MHSGKASVMQRDGVMCISAAHTHGSCSLVYTDLCINMQKIGQLMKRCILFNSNFCIFAIFYAIKSEGKML